MNSADPIQIEGIQTGRAAGLNASVPRNELVALTGPMGSGKYALLFDTLFAEGYHRYLLAGPTHGVGGKERVLPPRVQRITNLPPVLKLPEITEKTRVTLAEILGIKGFLLRLFLHATEITCPGCQRSIVRYLPDEIPQEVLRRFSGEEVIILFTHSGPPAWLYNRGYLQELLNGHPQAITPGDKDRLIVLHQLVAEHDRFQDLREAINRSLQFQGNHALIFARDKIHHFPTGFYCPSCEHTYPLPRPRFFTFQTGGSPSDVPTLPPEAQWYRVRGKNLPQLLSMSLPHLRDFLDDIPAGTPKSSLSNPAAEIQNRIESALRLRIHHSLHGGQRGQELSSGERMKLLLARLHREPLTNILLLLDSMPSIYHDSDRKPVLEILRDIQTRGNSVLWNEHHPSILNRVDRVLEIFRKEGDGDVELRECRIKSPKTKRSPKATLPVPPSPGEWIDCPIDIPVFPPKTRIRFPRRSVSCLSGPSGSGKSLLLREILRREGPRKSALFRFQEPKDLLSKQMEGTIASRFGIYASLRKLLSNCRLGRLYHYLPGDFSSFSPRGRCTECRGKGLLQTEKNHIPATMVPCPACRGTGIRPGPASILYRGKTIGEIMSLSLRSAMKFLGTEIGKKGHESLERLCRYGFGSFALGERFQKIPPGQREALRLVDHALTQKQSSLILLDSPSKGFCPRNPLLFIHLLIDLVNTGHTVVLAENHPAFIPSSSHQIDLKRSPVESLTRISGREKEV